MFFLVFVLFTSRWSVRKVLDCFFNMHLCAKLQPYRSNNFAHLLNYLELLRITENDRELQKRNLDNFVILYRKSGVFPLPVP